MNLTDAYNLALREMDKWLDDSWMFVFNNRKSAFGLCSYRKKTIELSRPLTEIETEEQILDTIRHEIAHALAGPEAKHGPMWKVQCLKVGCSYERAGSLSEGVKEPNPKYVMICPKGQIVKSFHRKPNASTYKKLEKFYIPSRKEETLGKLRIVPFEKIKQS